MIYVIRYIIRYMLARVSSTNEDDISGGRNAGPVRFAGLGVSAEHI